MILDLLLISVTPIFDRKQKKPKQADHYYEVELTPLQRDALLDLTESRAVPMRIKAELNQAARNARRLELMPVRLDWEEIEAEAERQGCSAADILYDRARGRDA